MLTAHVENYTERFEELKSLYPAHWEELALNKKHVALSPQYNVYLARDAAGEVLLVTLRSSGELAGYFIGFVGPALHYSTCLTLTMDIFYVRPEFRNGAAGLKLFRAVEAEARRRGVQRMFVGSKIHKDASRLFQRLGYEPVETFYSLWLGEPD
jgi:GNAT superfamily N-acetyltransferase